MYRDYKIYYNRSYLLISGNVTQSNEIFDKVISDTEAIDELLKSHKFLFEGDINEKILVQTNKPGDVFCQLIDNTDVVIAGGGIVMNESNEVLLIKRRGFWDLPKGKIELKENILDGAVREVEEETGVKANYVNSTPLITYHTYKMKGKNCLKETSWYEMKSSSQNLTPQHEEDIEEARWVPLKKLREYESGCYPLIWDLLKMYAD